MSAKLGHYLRVLGSLFLLLAITTGLSILCPAPWNWIPAIVIAFIMAALIMLFFMRLRHSEPLLGLTSATGFIWLSFLLLLVMLECISRPWQ